MSGLFSRCCPGILALSLVALTTVSARTEELPQAPTFTVDLDGDGAPETISTQKLRDFQECELHQLVVRDGKGQKLYTSPADLKPGEPLALGYFPFGTSLPEFAGDIDGDKAIELLIPRPRTDARSPSYWVLKWEKGAFTLVREGSLIETPSGSGHFVWTAEQTGIGQWVDQFLPMSGGDIEATLYESTTEDPMRQGKAILMPVARGFDRARWTVPLQAPAPVEEE